MRKRNGFKIIPLLGCCLLLSSCNIYDLLPGQNSSYDPGTVVPPTPSAEGVYEKVDLTKDYTYRDISLSSRLDAIPSEGEYTLLVLPIEFTDYPFSSSDIDNLNTALSAENGTGYWESLSSYYEKASYGKLKLHFEIADIYDTNMTAYTAYSKYAGIDDNGITLINAALTSYKRSNATKKFDSDGNGYLDGVIAVYSCPDSQSGDLNFNDADDFYWAYTYWATSDPNTISPNLNLYFWMSIDFIYTEPQSVFETRKIDAHTLCHEFGHMLGLDDYYPAGNSTFYPTGWLTMMDGNILDHDAFSKIALGWIEPTVVTDTATVEITTSASAPQAIVIPSSDWNWTAFSEYIVLELYTPTELNELDSKVQYPGRPRGYTIPGVRMYHVDARLAEVTLTASAWGDEINSEWDYYYGTKLNPADTSSMFRYYQVAATNCYKDAAFADPAYSLIELIDASSPKTDPFKRGEAADNDTLFTTGEEFSLSKYSAYFPGIVSLNDGTEFPYSIKFNYVGSDKANITITKE